MLLGSFSVVGLERRYTNEEDAYASCCRDANAHRVWRTKCPKGQMLRAMPIMSGTPSGLLHQVGASTSGLTPEEAGSSTKVNQFEDQQRVTRVLLD
jgi:hypothetical protein